MTAKRAYEEAYEYLDLWNKTILIQHRALTCLSKSLAHILQRELYSMGNSGLPKREAKNDPVTSSTGRNQTPGAQECILLAVFII